MKKVGIICEYNPLHNGHVYHFNKIKEESKADYIILSLSGYLTQRGDLAILDKFTRTKLALEMGVDLVIECPSLLSMNEALIFANAHVRNLATANVDEIWIGSEEGNEELYKKYYNLIQKKVFKDILDNFIQNGQGYKEAFNKAISSFNIPPLKSNDMLGLFYYEAIIKINPNIKLKTIKRTNSFIEEEYNATSIQSASSIRANLKDANLYVPPYVKEYLSNTLDNDLLIPFIKFNIINNNLKELAESTEGIENRLKNIRGNTIEEMVKSLKTKRYSESKIRRLLIDCCFNIKKTNVLDSITNYNSLRILGFNENGQNILKELKDNANIYTNIKEGINNTFDFEIKIAKTLDLIYHTNFTNQEITKPIIKRAN